MMSSSPKQDTAGLKVPRRGKKGGGMQYAMFMAVAAFLVLIILVVAVAFKKPAASGKAPKAASSSSSSGSRSRRDGDAPRTTRRDRDRDRGRSRDRDRGGDRSSGSSYGSGAYSGRRSGRSSSQRLGVPVLTTIISSPQGSRVAVFGSRSVRIGDQIEGRQVLEVGPDKVKVQFRTETYEVRVGEPLYQPQ
jgi:Ni/Co efflux regulator RcnB